MIYDEDNQNCPETCNSKFSSVKQIDIQINSDRDIWIEVEVADDYWELRYKDYQIKSQNFDLQCMPLPALVMLKDFLNYAIQNIEKGESK